MPRTGRPRAFDRDVAVEKAMRLFWEQGYEVTSLDQLKRAMGGISAASFYAAFGSKEALFREALAQYNRTHGQVTAPLHDTELPPRFAIERTLRGSARMQTESLHPSGCLIALSTSAWSPENAELQSVVQGERHRNRDAIRTCITRAVVSGELRADTDIVGLAALFDGLLLGFSVQARDGVSIEAMEASITSAFCIWETHRRPG